MIRQIVFGGITAMSIIVSAAALATAILLLATTSYAEVILPEKSEWTLADGTKIHGAAYGFGYQLCFLQRRRAEVYMNGQTLKDPRVREFVHRLCDDHGIPIDNDKQMQKLLSQRPFSQIVLPYYTLRYHDQTGKDQQIPTILLSPQEVQELRPFFEDWLAEKQREHEERLFKAQTLQNQRDMVAAQQEAADAQWAAARSAEDAARETRRAADAAESIDRKLKSK
jgi:hypothetical protein